MTHDLEAVARNARRRQAAERAAFDHVPALLSEIEERPHREIVIVVLLRHREHEVRAFRALPHDGVPAGTHVLADFMAKASFELANDGPYDAHDGSFYAIERAARIVFSEPEAKATLRSHH